MSQIQNRKHNKHHVVFLTALLKKGIINNLNASFSRRGNNKHRTAHGDGSEMEMNYVLLGINYAEGCGGKEIQQIWAKKPQNKTDLEIIHSCLHSCG